MWHASQLQNADVQGKTAQIINLLMMLSNVLWACVACLQPASNLHVYKHALGAFLPSARCSCLSSSERSSYLCGHYTRPHLGNQHTPKSGCARRAAIEHHRNCSSDAVMMKSACIAIPHAVVWRTSITFESQSNSGLINTDGLCANQICR